MKLISAFYVAAAVGATAITWKFVEPMFAKNGSAVLTVSTDGKRGGNMAVKLPKNLTAKQLELLNFAYKVAKEDGYKQPVYLQGVLMQETRAGGMDNYRVSGLENKPGDRYFGAVQLKLAAAKDVLKQYPEMRRLVKTNTDEELQAMLITDDHFNIRIASKYLLMMGVNTNPTFATTAYNRGKGGAQLVDPETWHYTVAVKQHIEKLK